MRIVLPPEVQKEVALSCDSCKTQLLVEIQDVFYCGNPNYATVKCPLCEYSSIFWYEKIPLAWRSISAAAKKTNPSPIVEIP